MQAGSCKRCMAKIAASEPLKRITGRILELVSSFTEASEKVKLNPTTVLKIF